MFLYTKALKPDCSRRITKKSDICNYVLSMCTRATEYLVSRVVDKIVVLYLYIFTINIIK